MSKYKFLAIEKVGVLLSIACTVHCLTLPIFLFFAPYLASSFAFSSNLEWILVLSSFLLAAIILVLDYKKHRQPLPCIFGPRLHDQRVGYGFSKSVLCLVIWHLVRCSYQHRLLG